MLNSNSYWTQVLVRRINRRRALAGSAAATIGAALLAACGGDDDSQGGSQSDGEDGLVTKPVDTTNKAVKGGVLSLVGGEPNSFDFTAGSGAPNYGVHAYSRLVKYETFKYPDTPVARAAPDAATSWEVSPDGLTYTYKLRAGMKFDPRPPTNGRELTSEDVTFSWNRFATKSSFRSTMVNSIDPEAPVVSVTAPDKSTVVAKLAFPFGPFNIYFGYYRYGQIMPVESDGGGFDPRSDARGTGVWRLKSYTPSVGYEYERNPDWYDASRVFLNGISYAVLPEYSTALAQFQVGRVGTYEVLPQDILSTKQLHPEMLLQPGEQFPTSSSWIRFSYLPNSPFRDERVRQALSLLLDRQLYVDTFGNVDQFSKNGLDVPTRFHSPIPCGMEGFWADPKDEAAIGAGAKYFKYDPAEAKKLLTAAGHSGPVQTKFTYATSSPQEEAAVLKEMWEKNGDFRLTSSVVDFVNEFRPNYSQNFDQHEGIAFSGAQGYPDVDGWLWVYYKDGSPRAGHVDSNGKPDSELNRLITAQRSELDEKKRATLVKDFQRHAASKVYMLNTPGAATEFKLAWPWLGNFGMFRSNQESWPASEGYTHYWIDESKKKA